MLNMLRLWHALLVVFGLVLSLPLYGEAPSPPGQLVDIGGYKLHLHCIGSGSPTVVFENGSADFSFVWDLVQPGVSKFTRACSYDRAGSAWSDPGPMPRSFEQINLELHTALTKAGIGGPYVMVGQSYGGFLVRAFAEKYKSDVVGVVLVDAAHENERVNINGQVVRIRDMAKGTTLPPPRLQLNDSEVKQYAALREKPIEKGPPAVEPPYNKLPLGDQKAELWAIVQPFLPVAVGSELDSSQEEVAVWYSSHKIASVPLGHTRLVVLTRGKDDYQDTPDISAQQLAEERHAEQIELTKLSNNSKQVIAAKRGHNIQLEDPELVVQVIRDVVEAVKK
jgi:pimeloyl-ACP methyl ester carboxylesterase